LLPVLNLFYLFVVIPFVVGSLTRCPVVTSAVATLMFNEVMMTMMMFMQFVVTCSSAVCCCYDVTIDLENDEVKAFTTLTSVVVPLGEMASYDACYDINDRYAGDGLITCGDDLLCYRLFVEEKPFCLCLIVLIW